MIYITRDLLNQIREHSMKELPNEACGILAGKLGNVQKVYEVINIDKNPSAFFMEAKEQLKVMKEIRSLGLEMIGIYHSHVASSAYPSAHDLEMAFYPEVSYVIISIKDQDHPIIIRSFRIAEGKVVEEEVKIVDS